MTVFRVGQEVTFNPNNPLRLSRIPKIGTYLVTRIQQVSAESVGHIQWVWIDHPDEKSCGPYSGAYFEPDAFPELDDRLSWERILAEDEKEIHE